MTINEEEKRKILQEIINDQVNLGEIQPGEFTLSDLIRDYGITRYKAEHLINQLIKEKKITRRKAITNGKSCVAYAFTE